MTSKILIYVLAPLAATVALVSCGDKGSSSAPKPRDLRAEAMAAKPLNAQDKAEFAAIFKKAGNGPDADLYFTNDYSSGALKSRYDKLSEEGKRIIALAKAKCKIEPENEKTIKDEKPSDNRSIKTTETNKSISGDASCPLEYRFTNTSTTDSNRDPASGAVSGTTVFDIHTREAAKSDDLKRLTFFVSSEAKSHTTVTSSFRVGADRRMTGTTNWQSEASGVFLDAEGKSYPSTLGMEVLKEDENLRRESTVIRFALPSGKELVIGNFINGGKRELFVNGEPYTNEKWQAEFGTASPFSSGKDGSGTSLELNL